MDQRLSRVAGLRPERLTPHELPGLARAMIAYVYKQVRLTHVLIQGVTCVRFYGPSTNFLVRQDDWIKVVPYLKDGSFDNLTVSVSAPLVRDRGAFYEESVVDINDPLYRRILNVLTTLFPGD